MWWLALILPEMKFSILKKMKAAVIVAPLKGKANFGLLKYLKKKQIREGIIVSGVRSKRKVLRLN